jgi:alkylated DNA repair dioxygenase AlkB
MQTLFDEAPAYPQGFSYEDNFISPDEHDKLLQFVRSVELKTFMFQGFEAKRKVASFGYDYSFDKARLSEGKPIPDIFIPLISRVSTHLNIPVAEFAELLVTEYPVGAVINWHRDAPPFDLIAGLSLASPCVFKLRPHDKAKQGRGSIININVNPRSLYVISGTARSDWQHSTAPVKNVRYSITLRTLLKK